MDPIQADKKHTLYLIFPTFHVKFWMKRFFLGVLIFTTSERPLSKGRSL